MPGLAAAGVVIVVLVILGAIIIDRSGSGESEPDHGQADGSAARASDLTEEEAAALDEASGAGNGSQDAVPDTERWDLCELLREATAEGLVDMDLFYRGNLDVNSTCQYKSEDSPIAVTVTLKGDATTVYHCHTEPEPKSGDLVPCPVTGEPVPSLPEGQVSWHQKPPEAFSDTSPGGVWVQWEAADRQWGLWYSDQRRRDERADVLQRKDELITMAEAINSMILDGVGQT